MLLLEMVGCMRHAQHSTCGMWHIWRLHSPPAHQPPLHVPRSNVPHPALAMAGGPSSGNAAAKRAPTPAKAAATPVKSTTTSIQLTASPAAPASSGGSPLNVRRSSRLRQKVQ